MPEFPTRRGDICPITVMAEGDVCPAPGAVNPGRDEKSHSQVFIKMRTYVPAVGDVCPGSGVPGGDVPVHSTGVSAPSPTSHCMAPYTWRSPRSSVLTLYGWSRAPFRDA